MNSISMSIPWSLTVNSRLICPASDYGRNHLTDQRAFFAFVVEDDLGLLLKLSHLLLRFGAGEVLLHFIPEWKAPLAGDTDHRRYISAVATPQESFQDDPASLDPASSQIVQAASWQPRGCAPPCRNLGRHSAAVVSTACPFTVSRARGRTC